MRIKLFLLIIAVCYFVSCEHTGKSTSFTIKKNNSATLTLINQYPIGKDSNFFVSEDNFIDKIIFEGRQIHILNSKENKLITINLDTKNTRLNDLSPIIDSFSKKYSSLIYLSIDDKYYVLTFIKAVLCIEKSTGRILTEIPSKLNMQYAFMYNNIITIFKSGDSIFDYNIKGERINAIESPYTVNGRFFNVQESIVAYDNNEYTKYNKNSKKLHEEIFPFSQLAYKENDLWLSDINEKHSIWFPYSDRSKIILLDEKNNTVEEINLHRNFSPRDLSVFESGFPFFNVVAGPDNSYYFVAQKNSVIYVYKVST